MGLKSSGWLVGCSMAGKKTAQKTRTTRRSTWDSACSVVLGSPPGNYCLLRFFNDN